jgi:hypothetical protein
MSILDDARKLLESVGYSTISGQTNDTFSFEDSALLGFVWGAPSVDALLEGWQRRQDDFLSLRNRELRRAREKSWNVYAVLLTEDEPEEKQFAELAAIEEDFRGTRKIARGGLRATFQISRALLPLLPIQNSLSLGDIDATSRLRARLSSIGAKTADLLLDPMLTQSGVELIIDADENQ